MLLWLTLSPGKHPVQTCCLSLCSQSGTEADNQDPDRSPRCWGRGRRGPSLIPSAGAGLRAGTEMNTAVWAEEECTLGKTGVFEEKNKNGL